jgi:WD40 repeat protein
VKGVIGRLGWQSGLVLVAGLPAAAGFAYAATCVVSVAAVRNAGITWSSSDAIQGAHVDGSGQHVLVPQFADGEGDPAWTRDGRALAIFASFSDTSEIFVLRPGAPKNRKPIRWRCGQPFVQYAAPLKRWLRRARCRFLGSAGNFRSSEPSWSPDAKRIAVTEDWGSFGAIRQATIKIVSVASNKWRSVTRPKRNRIDLDPAWSPDGRTIAFARQDHGSQTIYLTLTDGSATRPLTMGRSPSWSPDGKNITFALGDSIYRIRVDGRARTRIVSGLVGPRVRWSPDGRKLLYTTDSADKFHADVWAVNVDGTHRRRVLHNQAIEGIAWRP